MPHKISCMRQVTPSLVRELKLFPFGLDALKVQY